VDTGQKLCYDSLDIITAPSPDDRFYGQDAQFDGNQPSYAENEPGIITDLVTGLQWQKNLFDSKFTYDEIFAVADTFSLGGYTDWRVPTVKELYSLILFDGRTGLNADESIPFINTEYFEFRYGDEYNPSERYIDAQYATSTVYLSTTMNNEPTMFGVNFADGRIKGYPQDKDFELKLVRGGNNYGVNDLVDNGDGTISDKATGLMWDKSGSQEGKNWEEALEWISDLNNQNYLGYEDWRLPNAKELQSLLDYSNAPLVNSKPAIDDLFDVPQIITEGGNEDFPFYWTSTTHEDGPTAQKAVYICFGTAYGFMEAPPGSGNYLFMDVHGAGAQRSDPKTGDPDNYPNGFGPQGDVIRIFNYVRAVRDDVPSTGIKNGGNEETPDNFGLNQNYPNPFNPDTVIRFTLAYERITKLTIYNMLGEEVATLIDGVETVGEHSINFRGDNLSSGTYLYRLTSGSLSETKKMILMK